MRTAPIRSALVLAAVGAGSGVLVALGANWWFRRETESDLGVPRRYVDYLPSEVSTDWWGLLWPAVVAGAVLGLLVAVGSAVAGRRFAVGTGATRRAREAGALAASGAVLGLAVSGLLYLVTRLQQSSSEVITTYRGTYVPLEGLEKSTSYESSLSITVDPIIRGEWELAAVCAVAGVLLGLLVFGALLLTKRRIAVVSASSPTGSARR